MAIQNLKILTISSKTEEKFLRIKTANFDFKTRSTNSGQKFTKKEIDELLKRMREAMIKANGVGLSANQVGLNLRMFVYQEPDKPLKTVFNPEIVKSSKKTATIEEGCLSIPGIYGEVERPEKTILTGQDKNGRKIKIEAFGLLARIFQHEVDHLNGILFIDKAFNLRKYENVQKYENK